MDIILIRAGLCIIGVLGVLHLIYTLQDLHTPKRFVPTDETLLVQLQATGVKLVKNSWPGRSFWGSFMGFNLSHSVGILAFVAVFMGLGSIAPVLVFHPFMLCILLVTMLSYVVMSRLFWFSIPFYGASFATILIMLGAGFHFFG